MEKMKKEKKQKEEPKEFKRIDPLSWFFKLGDYVTKGDPIRQQDFTYYMIWILFIAFLGIFLTNLYRFIVTLDISFLFWALFGFAICSLQYFNLKSFYQMRKARKEMPEVKPEDEHKIEDVNEMLKSFSGKKESDTKEEKK